MLPILGFSIGNSYFKAEIIYQLIAKASSEFERVIIFIPDLPYSHTLCALGYEENKAMQKARLKGNNLRNHVSRSIAKLSLSQKEVVIIDWENECGKNQLVQSKIENIISHYRENSSFRLAARSATEEVLKKKLNSDQDLQKAIDRGVFYLLEELAFLSAAPEIYQESVCYLYHQPWPVFEQWIDGKLNYPPPKGLFFQLFPDR